MLVQTLGERWHWTSDAVPGIDFCVRVLQQDGLRVPPFDRHPDGDGRLRAAGLTSANWQAWLATLLDARLRISRSIWPSPPELVEAVLAPHTAWPGDPEVGTHLERLWSGYQASGEAWKRRYSLEADPTRLTAAEHRPLWRQITPFRAQLPAMHIFLVEYPEVVLAPYPPACVLVATGGGRLDAASYTAAVVRAASALAGQA